MTQRLHKVLIGAGENTFLLAVDASGKPLTDPTADAQKLQPTWPAYTSACLDIHTLDCQQTYDKSAHRMWVLRAEMRCCCAHDCPQPQDHGWSYSQVPKATAGPAAPSQTPHGPGQGHVEAILDLAALGQLASVANECSSDSSVRASEAALLASDAQKFGLTAANIENQLGIAGVDGDGMLSATGRVAGVLAGTVAPSSSTDKTAANDYYVVACYINLYQRLVVEAWKKLTAQWPTHGVQGHIRHADYAPLGVSQ